MSDENRKARGKTQNIFLIETIINDNLNERKYAIMGSTGKLYYVTIDESPICTCPDFATRHIRCKHIYFVLIRVMKVSKENEDQKKYTKQDLETMFNNIPNIMNNLIADVKIRDNYNKIKNNNFKPVQTDKKDSDDLCPICLDDLTNGDELDYCKYSCGKQIHKLCFSMWIKKNAHNCVFCRKSWFAPIEQEYIDLTGNTNYSKYNVVAAAVAADIDDEL